MLLLHLMSEIETTLVSETTLAKVTNDDLHIVKANGQSLSLPVLK